MYRPRYLVVPILEAGLRRIIAYLPAGTSWSQLDGETYQVETGGCGFLSNRADACVQSVG